MKKAKWIWVKREADDKVNQYVEFRHIVHLNKAGQYTFRLSVAGNYCLFVNGKFVACARFDDYPEYKMYDEIEKRDKKLTKATEIIKSLIALHYNPVVTKDDLKKQDKILEQAEQFLKEAAE